VLVVSSLAKFLPRNPTLFVIPVPRVCGSTAVVDGRNMGGLKPNKDDDKLTKSTCRALLYGHFFLIAQSMRSVISQVQKLTKYWLRTPTRRI
jgi:hypothetical protein